MHSASDNRLTPLMLAPRTPRQKRFVSVDGPLALDALLGLADELTKLVRLEVAKAGLLFELRKSSTNNVLDNLVAPALHLLFEELLRFGGE
jgi:hypothetical protein